MATEEDVSKSTLTKSLMQMELNWTKLQKEVWNSEVEEAAKKKVRSGEYEDLLLRKCKQHGGPMSSLTELKRFVNSSDDKVVLKKLLREEIGFQKMMHPVDVRERSFIQDELPDSRTAS